VKLYPTAVEQFLSHPTTSIRAESSKRSMRMTIRLFQTDHPELELHELTTQHLEDWLGGKLKGGVSDATVKKYMQRMNTFLDWCSWRRLVDRNPGEHLDKTLRLRPQPVQTHRWLDEAQVKLILDSLDTLTVLGQRDALILRLGFMVGLRNNEIRTLPLSALENVDRQQISLKGKGGKLAQVYVPEKTALPLAAWRDQYENPRPDSPVVIAFRNLQDWTTGKRILTPQWGIGITQQALGRIVAHRSTAAGFKVAPHDMRRSFAGMMAERTDIVATSKALRHSQIATTELYLKRRQDSAFQAARGAGLDL
jgi:site-specific recombinase XerD